MNTDYRYVTQKCIFRKDLGDLDFQMYDKVSGTYDCFGFGWFFFVKGVDVGENYLILMHCLLVQ